MLLRNCTARSVEPEIWSPDLSALNPKFNPEEWTTYELQFSAGTLRALVNGKVVQPASRPPRRRGGYLAVKAQGGISTSAASR